MRGELKENFFDRDSFVEIFSEVFGEDLYDFIDGVYGKHKDPCTGFDYNTFSYKCFRDEEDYWILNKRTGVAINWYKGQHLGRCNGCNDDSMTLEDLKVFLTGLKEELAEWYFNEESSQ